MEYMEYEGKLTFQSMSHHEMFCSSIGFFEIAKSRFGDLGGVEEGWVGVGVVEFVMMVVIIISVVIIIMVVVVVVVFFGFICVVLVVVAILQIQIPHRRGRIKSCRYFCSRPCFPASQIPMIRKRFRNIRGSLRTVGTGCVGFLVVVVVAAAVQRNTSLVILNTSSSTTTSHHRAPNISLLSLIRNFQLTNRNRRAIRNTSKAQSEHGFIFSRAGSRTFLR